MKAIETHYLPASRTRPSRIVARDLDNNRVVITHPGGVGVMPHALAARYLCAKMGWTGELAAGATSRGYVFVWLDYTESSGRAVNKPFNVMKVTTDGSATLPEGI